jgi:hypothetical protein
VKPLAVLLLALLFLGCTQPVFPTTPRASARAVVLASASSVKNVAQMCRAIVDEAGDQSEPAAKASALSFGINCKRALIPIVDGIILAADAVDGWDAYSAAKVGCGMKAASVGLSRIIELVFLSGRKVPGWLIDSAQIASQLAPWALSSCDPLYPTNEVKKTYADSPN